MTNNEEGFEPYSVPDPNHHPATFVARLLETEEHEHLAENEITIEYLMANTEKKHGGKMIAGAVHLPTVQGRLKDLFEMLLARFFGTMPMFLMIIDSAWWHEADQRDREALIWHELCHIKQERDKFGDLRFDRDGLPVYGLIEHDVTSFNSEVARYGAWSPELQQFFAAARSADQI